LGAKKFIFSDVKKEETKKNLIREDECDISNLYEKHKQHQRKIEEPF
jgi:hypothetical protein